MKQMRSRLVPVFGKGEAEAMIRLVFDRLKGWSLTDMVIHSDSCISDFTLREINAITDRVLAGEPIQYVLGLARFYGMDLKVTPAVLIPRPETAELVDMIVKENREPDLRVLDAGTGSGAIAVALSRNLRFPQVTALDVSGEALEIAKENAVRLHARIDFVRADIFEYKPAAASFDILVSNPPYITENEKSSMEPQVLDHEPHKALFVPDGAPLGFYSRLAEAGISCLAPGGRIYLELNPRFAQGVADLLKREGFAEVRLHEDMQRKVRFATALKPNEP